MKDWIAAIFIALFLIAMLILSFPLIIAAHLFLAIQTYVNALQFVARVIREEIKTP